MAYRDDVAEENVPLEAREDKRARKDELRRVAEHGGLVVQWSSGEPVRKSERKPVKITGTPLSEQIIADRR